MHIPKTGGTTVTFHLKTQDTTCRLFWNYDDGYDLAHITCKDVDKFIDMNSIHGYKWYVIVRNPYDRIYSAYVHIIKNKRLKNLNFTDFLLDLNTNIKKWGVHTLPMVTFCSMDDVIKYNIIVMKTETLNADFKKMLNKYDLNESFENCNIGYNRIMYNNENERFRYESKYTSENIDSVNSIYAEDFKAFYKDEKIVKKN